MLYGGDTQRTDESTHPPVPRCCSAFGHPLNFKLDLGLPAPVALHERTGHEPGRLPTGHPESPLRTRRTGTQRARRENSADLWKTPSLGLATMESAQQRSVP
jgi:hypothetical protein